MAEFLIYQGKAAIALAVFYMFYRLLLSKETFHRFNRIVLLGTATLSFVLPPIAKSEGVSFLTGVVMLNT